MMQLKKKFLGKFKKIPIFILNVKVMVQHLQKQLVMVFLKCLEQM